MFTEPQQPAHLPTRGPLGRWILGAPALLAVLTLIYLATLAAMPPEGLTHHDTGAKYLQVRNLRLTPGCLDYSINYPARPLDPQLEFVPFRERQYFIDGQGRIYLQWPIFLGLLTRIPWKIMGFWGLYVVPLLAGVGAAWASYRLALAAGIPRRPALLAIPVVGLATPLSIYSLLFFEHTLAAMLVALSLYFAVKSLVIAHKVPARRSLRAYTGTSHGAIVASAVLLAAGVYFRSDLYILVLVMTLAYGLMSWRIPAWRGRLLLWLAAFAISLVPLWAFYAITEGTLLPLHATWYFASSEGPSEPGGPLRLGLPALRYIARAGWGIIPDFLMGPQTYPLSPIFPLWVGVLGVGGTGLCALAALGRLLRGAAGSAAVRLSLFVVGLVAVSVASAYVLLLPDPYHNLHGFVLAAPFVALALWPPAEIWTEKGFTAQGFLYTVTLGHVALHALVISSLSGLGPISRHEWGQRYLFTAYPALAVLALLAAWRLWTEYRPQRGLVRTWANIGLVAAALLVLVGALFSVRGYVVLYSERTQAKAWQDLMRTLPGREPLLTDDWWLPLNLAADFYTRPIMLAAGDDRLADWAGKMQARGVTAFGFMTGDPAVFNGSWVSRVGGLHADGPPIEVRGIWLQRYTLQPR